MSASKCPVCNGRGTVDPGFYSPFQSHPDVVRTSSSLPMREPCRACGGKGLVWPPNTYYPPMPQIPVSVPELPQWTPPVNPLSPPYRVTC